MPYEYMILINRGKDIPSFRHQLPSPGQDREVRREAVSETWESPEPA